MQGEVGAPTPPGRGRRERRAGAGTPAQGDRRAADQREGALIDDDLATDTGDEDQLGGGAAPGEPPGVRRSERLGKRGVRPDQRGLPTGGTSGPLFGMWFRELSKATAQSADAGALAAGVAAGVGTVQRLGRARVGDKTMVDAMLPAAEAMIAPR